MMQLTQASTTIVSSTEDQSLVAVSLRAEETISDCSVHALAINYGSIWQTLKCPTLYQFYNMVIGFYN